MTLKDRHAKIRATAAAKIYDLVRQAVAADAEHQKSKPEVIKAIDAALNEHVFRKLFT